MIIHIKLLEYIGFTGIATFDPVQKKALFLIGNKAFYD
ncbi:hypothetical protein BSBH6_02626 [Bacillus subtilis]|nr:hypothetical protein BSBH6_02626 [Bacillus subtilis]RPK23596.1 hypothetical protein BH5_02623 [Bacillus subtilis]